MKNLSCTYNIVAVTILLIVSAACSKKDDPVLKIDQPGTFEISISGDLDTEIIGEASFDQVIVSSNQPGAGGSTLSIFLESGNDYSHSMTLTKSESDGFGKDTYNYTDGSEALLLSMTFIDYEEVKTYKITSGNIQITAVKDEWIEGSLFAELSDPDENSISIEGTFKAKGATLIYGF